MVEAPGTRLLTTCESLCDRLRRSVGLTTFRIEVERPIRPLVVSLRAPDGMSSTDPRHEGTRPPAARLDLTVRHDRRVLAHVRIEDEEHARYSEDARATCERIVAEYAPELCLVLETQAL